MSYEQIITNFSSPTLVLAGPGAGKTYLLSDRVKRLLESGRSKDTITVLTFGKDASQHMRKALVDPEGDFKIESTKVPNISTMHSLGLRASNKMNCHIESERFFGWQGGEPKSPQA